MRVKFGDDYERNFRWIVRPERANNSPGNAWEKKRDVSSPERAGPNPEDHLVSKYPYFRGPANRPALTGLKRYFVIPGAVALGCLRVALSGRRSPRAFPRLNKIASAYRLHLLADPFLTARLKIHSIPARKLNHRFVLSCTDPHPDRSRAFRP